jgi:hypothetical protein
MPITLSYHYHDDETPWSVCTNRTPTCVNLLCWTGMSMFSIIIIIYNDLLPMMTIITYVVYIHPSIHRCSNNMHYIVIYQHPYSCLLWGVVCSYRNYVLKMLIFVLNNTLRILTTVDGGVNIARLLRAEEYYQQVSASSSATRLLHAYVVTLRICVLTCSNVR